MQIEEASALVSLSPDVLVEERLDEILFEAKRFFSGKPIIREVFKRRLEKLQKQQQAFSLLIGDKHIDQSYVSKEWIPNGDMLGVFNSFSALRSEINRAIFQATSIREIVCCVEDLMDQYDRYLAYWNLPEFTSEIPVILGKEPDPMELIWAIKELQAFGIFTIEDLKKNSEHCPALLCSEIIRLSVLYKRIIDGGNV